MSSQIISDHARPDPAGSGGECEGAPAREEQGGRTAADMAVLAIYGILQHQYGRHDGALESCSAVARACPGYPPAHAGRARALSGLGRPDEALHAFCDAIACDPECAPAHADYALAVTRLGCHEDAVAAYGEAIRLAPDSGDVRAGQAFALAGAGRLEDALEACKEAARLDPESAVSHAAYGRVMAGMGRTGDALSAFDRAAALDPGSASAHAGRGLALGSLGRHADALSAYERAIGIDRYHELARAGRNRTGRRCARGGECDSDSGPGHGPGPGPGRRLEEGAAPASRAGDWSALPGRRSACAAAAVCRAIDPDHASARGYIEHCLSHAPRAGGSAPAASLRPTPLTEEEAAGLGESASCCEAVEMEGSEFADTLRAWAGAAERAGRGEA